MPKSLKPHLHSELIDKLGGTVKAAEFFEVSPPSVSEWRKSGLPKARLMYLKALRADLFSSLDSSVASSQLPSNEQDENAATASTISPA